MRAQPPGHCDARECAAPHSDGRALVGAVSAGPGAARWTSPLLRYNESFAVPTDEPNEGPCRLAAQRPSGRGADGRFGLDMRARGG